MNHQFTICPEGRVTINPKGVVSIDRKPAAAAPGQDYSKQPVQVALRHDLTLELHGAKFSVGTKLSVDQALGLINLLAYVVREQVALRGAK